MFFVLKSQKILSAAGGCIPIPYQNLGGPLITIAICRLLQNQRGVFQAKNAANCDPSNFSIILGYSGGFAAQLNILVCDAAH